MVELTPFGEPSDVTSYQPYEQPLAEVFAEVRTLIRQKLPANEVEHIGSTSIPGVGGRNVIDIAVLAPEGNHGDVREQLLEAGFEASPFPHYLPLLVATASRSGRGYPVLVYVVSPDNDVYTGWIAFRDHMRANPDDAEAYDAVKRQAISNGLTANESYQVAKTPFIVELIQRIDGERGAP